MGRNSCLYLLTRYGLCAAKENLAIWHTRPLCRQLTGFAGAVATSRKWKTNHVCNVIQSRYLSIESDKKTEIQLTEDFLYLNTNNGSQQFSWFWLRDHCRSEMCYNHQTNQKNLLIDPSASQSSTTTPADVELQNDGTELKITWKDKHISTYDLEWLRQNSFSTVDKLPVKPFYWTGERMRSEERPVVSYDDHMKTEDGLKQSLYYLAKYGFTVVQGAPVTIEDTGKVAERVANIMETCFGRIWSFTSDLKRADTAYSNIGIGGHTDTTYFTCPAGVQVFHCMEHNGDGGETLLIDGFEAANKLRQEHEEDFNYLTKAVVAHEFLDQKYRDHYYSLGHVLSVSPTTNKISHIRFNMYDLAPLSTIPQTEVKQFYTAYNRLRTTLFDPTYEYWLKLKPGMILFVDNWRVLHGRSSFNGKRVVCGCYINRDDLTNAYRRHNLL